MTSLHPIPLPLTVDSDQESLSLRRQVWGSWRRLMEAQPYRSTPIGPRRLHQPLLDPLLKIFEAGMWLSHLHLRGKRNMLAVRRVEQELVCPGLPEEFDGFRILHITDPHFDLHDGILDAVSRAVADLPADICVMTGDYRARTEGPFGAAMSALRRLLPHITTPEGVWATLGNHDSADMAEAIEAMGINLLVNEHACLRRGNARLRLVGLDDVHRFHTPLAQEALLAHAPATDGVFSVLLVHSPEIATAAARRGYSLYLCGHTHAGQIALPGGRPVMTKLDSHRAQARGLWRIHGMHGYTSPGAGGSGIPLRYFTRSEVTRFTLRRPRPTAML